MDNDDRALSKFPGATIRAWDDHLKKPYPEYLRFQLTCLSSYPNLIVYALVLALTWVLGGLLSHRWLPSAAVAVVVVCGLPLYMLVQAHIHRRRALRSQLKDVICVSPRGIHIDGSIFLFDRMNRVLLQQHTGPEPRSIIAIDWGIERILIDVPSDIALSSITQLIPEKLTARNS